MSIIVETPFQNFTGLDGKPLTNGKVYIGQVGTDPTVFANQIPVFWDEALTIPASQPLATNAGYIIRFGTPARVWVATDYSISVKNASNILVYYISQFGVTDLSIYAKLSVLASSIGSRLIGFIQRGTGPKLRTVEDKLYELITVDDYDGDTATAIESAAAVSSRIKFVEGATYTINRNVVLNGRVTIDARGAILQGDGVSITMNDCAQSDWIGGYLKNIVTPWVIIRNTATWASQTAADVIQSNEGYMPSSLDDDIWAGLTPAQQNQEIGIKLIFRSTSAEVQNDITVSGVRGRFTNIIFEGCSRTVVSDISIKGGKDYAAIVFYNDTNLQRLTNTPLGFTYARGYSNKVVDSKIYGATGCGVTYFGNDNFLLQGVDSLNVSESGFKTYQKDTTFGASVICKYGKIIGCVGDYARFDGLDFSATYPTTGTESGHNIAIGNMFRGNRSSGIFSDAQSNSYNGNQCLDNGLGGMVIKAANCEVSNNYMENNVRFPGILGEFSSYDLDIEGDDCTVNDNRIRRPTAPAYTYAYSHIGSGGSSNFNSVPYPSNIDIRVIVNVAATQDRISKVPTAFAAYFRTAEPASVQSVVKMHRSVSEGMAVQFLQGPSETTVGSISMSSTSTTYATSSDPRLKRDFAPVSGSGSYFDAIEPVTWVWKSNGEKGIGFDAAKYQKVSPGSVTGKPGEVDGDGRPIYQGVEYGSSEWVAYASAEIKDIRRRLSALETK